MVGFLLVGEKDPAFGALETLFKVTLEYITAGKGGVTNGAFIRSYAGVCCGVSTFFN
jgi:hypothetical protein